MHEDTLLAGIRVLVVEDDFLLSEDARLILEDAGADVLGPASNIGRALQLLAASPPDCALVDVNLGNGPNFDLAAELTARNIPFVFLTGYDAHVFPAAFSAVPRLPKPLDPRKLVDAIASFRSLAS